MNGPPVCPARKSENAPTWRSPSPFFGTPKYVLFRAFSCISVAPVPARCIINVVVVYGNVYLQLGMGDTLHSYFTTHQHTVIIFYIYNSYSSNSIPLYIYCLQINREGGVGDVG